MELKVFALALLCAAPAAAQTRIQKRGAPAAPAPQDDDGETGGSTPAPSPGRSVIVRERSQPVPAPQAVPAPERISPDARPAPLPSRDDRGARIVPRASTAEPPRNHAAIVRNPAITRDMDRARRTDRAGRVFWHRSHGTRYAHRFDGRLHWYGFTHGSAFYWTAFHHGRWWWHDAHFNRWVYWWDGYWWWPSPSGISYVYVDNDYYPYAEGRVNVRQPEEVPPPPAPEPAAAGESSWKSPDGKRLVQRAGPSSEAFLYDNASGSPVFMKYLGKNVDKVRFSGQRILVDFKDGSFALFTPDGEPVAEK